MKKKPRVYKPRRNAEIMRKAGPHVDATRKRNQRSDKLRRAVEELDSDDDLLERWARDIAEDW